MRIIAATNHDLYADVQEGKFREDLYYRLNVVTLELPALANRKADLVPVAQQFLDFFNQQYGEEKNMDSDYQNFLLRYSWPGNFRELRNTLERSVIFSEGETLDVQTLPANIRESDDNNAQLRAGEPVSLQKLEEEHIRQVLDRESTMKKAAKVLGMEIKNKKKKKKKMEEVEDSPNKDSSE